MIPVQLQNDNLRFIKIGNNDKRPLEKNWQKNNNYKFNDKELVNHILNGGNYGVIGGYGNLVILDFDSAEAYDKVRRFLPRTFTVLTANKKLPHVYYYITEPVCKSAKFIDDKKNTLIDMQGQGKQVVGPYSKIHNNIYRVWIDSEIKVVSLVHLRKLLDTLFVNLSPTLPLNQSMPSFHRSNTTFAFNVFDRISIQMILNKLGVTVTSRTHSNCPMHSSESGTCLHYNDKFWFCFSCNNGGNGVTLVKQALNTDFKGALEWAEQRFGK